MYRAVAFAFSTLATVAFLQVQAQAESSASSTSSTENSLKIDDVNPDKNKAAGDVDELITNNLLRAQTGSKSKYSIATTFAYYGGAVDEPLGQQRPNITAGNSVTAVALLAGDISGKYNIDQMHSVLAGFGVRWITPLYGTSTPAKYNGDKLDADNPYLTYQYAYKAAGLQNVFTVGPTLYTNANLLNEGYVAEFAVGQTSIYEIGHSGFSLGLSANLIGNGFNKNGGVDSQGHAILPQQTDYEIAFYPFAEYQLNRIFNLRTLVGVQFEHTRALASASDFQRDKVYESFGLGISVTRDIFLYPNIQFIPDELRPSQTNVGLTTNINVF